MGQLANTRRPTLVPAMAACLLLAVTLCRAGAEQAGAEGDPRLGRKVEVALVRKPLDEVLKACSAASGVACEARGSAVDLRVSVLTRGQPLRDVLATLGTVLNLELVRRREGEEWKYSLEETEACRFRQQAQVKADREAERRAFRALLAAAIGVQHDAPEWLTRRAREQASDGVIRMAAQLAASLPDRPLDAALDGRAVSLPLALLPPSARRLATDYSEYLYAQQVTLQQELRNREGGAPFRAAARKPPGDLEGASLQVRFASGGMSVSVRTMSGSAQGTSIPVPEPQYAYAIEQPRNFGARQVEPGYGERPIEWPADTTWEEAIQQLHKQSRWNIVSDAFDPERAHRVYPQDRARVQAAGVERVLDGLAFAFRRRWTAETRVLGFRTDYWYARRESQISEQVVQLWRGEAAATDRYSLDSLAEMAAIVGTGPERRSLLRRYAGLSVSFPRGRTQALLLYRSLSPALRRKAREAGVTLSELNRTQLSLLTTVGELLRPARGRFEAQPIGIRFREGSKEPTLDIDILYRDRQWIPGITMRTKAAPPPETWESQRGG